MFYKVFVHVHTDLVSLGSTKTLGARNTNWSSLSFASLLRDIRICIRYNNIYIICFLTKECKEDTHRLADYSLWPNFSTLASVTLWKSGEVSMFGSKLQFFCVFM